MSRERTSLNSKTYEFTYPSVAVWHDFGDLTLRASSRSSSVAKHASLNKKVKRVFQDTFEEQKKKKAQNMKRKNKSSGLVGTFIHPSEFRLEHSVLMPSSRAGIRLKPIKNAPVPPKESKVGTSSFPSVEERPKFYIPEKKDFVEEQRTENLDPISSWSPQDIREKTELAKEPSLFLDVNYGSDGDLDAIEIPELNPSCKKNHIMMKDKCKEAGLFPEINQRREPSVMEMLEDIQPQSDFVSHDKPDAMSPITSGVDNKRNENESFPRIDMLSPGNSSTDANVDSKEVNGKAVKKSDTQKLPSVMMPKIPVKTTARYSVKNRHKVPNVEAQKSSMAVKTSKMSKEFIVGGGRPLNLKRTIPADRKITSKQSKPSISTKRKQTMIMKKVKQTKVESPKLPDVLPNLSENVSLVECSTSEQIERMSIELDDTELKTDPKNEQPNATDSDEPASIAASVHSIESTHLEDFSAELEVSRMYSPRLLEFPLQNMKKYQKELFEEKRAIFRKLDIDGDGHLSLFELMRSFPKELSKYQVDYLKMIYQNACSSTFFGLEEFLCVEEMCTSMKVMSEKLREVFGRIDLRRLQGQLNEFMLIYSEAYDKTSQAASIETLLGGANTQAEHSELADALVLLQSLGKDLNKGLRKSDFLLLIPFVVNNGLDPESLLN